MKQIFFLLFSGIYTSSPLFSANNSWTRSSEEVAKRFIENKGQFDEVKKFTDVNILYGADWGKRKILFSSNELIFRLDNFIKNPNRIKGTDTPKYLAESDFIRLKWLNTNTNVQVEGMEKTYDYFSYLLNNGKNINYIPAYRKILYKNLYEKIDVVYEFHETDGIKYSLILHPGADISNVRMKYSDGRSVRIDSTGNLNVETKFGNIIDHAPVTFYEQNPGRIIPSSFIVNGNTVSFSLGNYDNTQTIIIDPWVQMPNYSNTNWKCSWECERDAAGNVYVIGGTSPLQLIKYNASGVIQWTYNTPYDTTEWLGTFKTDQAGNSYVTQGSPARIQKVSTTGSVVWDNPNPGGIFSLTEFWTITFNCDETRLVVGGTGGSAFQGPIPYVYNIDMNTGNVLNSAQVAGGAGLNPFNGQEVRAITACGNGNYYFLTHDSIGYIHQNFSFCSTTGGGPFRISSGADLSYKCENWRYSNTGIVALSYYGNFIFVHRGNQLQKRNFSNAAIVATVNIPGGGFNNQFGGNYVSNSGIDIDACGNIYVGSTNAVHKFDQNLNLLASYPTSYNVYDVAVNSGGEIIACGSTGTSATNTRTGYIQTFAASACATQSIVCCDASICNAGPFCATDPPVNLTSSQPGGTWSGTGITNPSTGTFDPSVAGSGTFTITYTLPCGSSSIIIVVNNCVAPTLCLEANGDITASGGGGPTYTWYVWQNGGSTPITNQAQCLACNPNYTWIAFPPPGQCLNGLQPVSSCSIAPGYQQFATGVTVTPPGNWPIQVIDGQGNVVTLNSTAGLPPCSGVVNVSTSQTNVLCNGQCTGTATVTASGGTQPYTYNWSGGQSTSAITGLCAGTYTVLVSDAAAITNTATVTITQPATALTATATATSASCGSGGSASVSAAGGTGNYTYSWAPSGGNFSVATGLSAGNYTATVTDANGCTATSTVTIITAPGGTVSVNANPILCNGDSATLNATMSGGTAPFIYSWTSGQTTSSVNLPAGNYTVTVTDANGCTSSQSVILTQPPAITSSVSVTNTLCGNNTGSATVTASGGTGNLTYFWVPSGGTSSTATGLGAGNYTCIITDANGCTEIVTANIQNANGPNPTIVSQTNVLCNGASTGSVSVSVSGGTAPYTYSWSNGSSASSATGLSAGIYTVTVTDASGCFNTQTVAITQPPAITGTITTTQASCGQNDGSASINPSGGTSPYTYLWNTFSSSQTITGVGAGNYSVIVTDANGCSKTFTATVTNPNGPTAIAGIAATIIAGNSTQLGASGGMIYSWTPSAGLSCTNCSNPVATPLQTTEYCVWVTDVNGCSDSACVLITVEPPCENNYYLPNAFSPNNDGENDNLRVHFANISCVREYKLAIYNRWGEKVFESENPAHAWDGTRKGKVMNTQVLAYYLRIVFTDGVSINKQGNISLVR